MSARRGREPQGSAGYGYSGIAEAMNTRAVRICALIAFGASFPGAVRFRAPLTGFPFTDEDLNYSLNWPSGINLGEAHLHAKRAGAKWDFAIHTRSGHPGFRGAGTSIAAQSAPDLCSMSFDRSTVHGLAQGEKGNQSTRGRGIATRVSKGGRRDSEFRCRSCVKDALTYLFYTREELGQGRVPAAQKILLRRPVSDDASPTAARR